MRATNLTELLWSDALCGLLRLCGTDERVLECGSDYERFLAVCKAMPLLQGHPYPATLKSFLKERLDLSLTPSPESAADIWRATAQRLLETPVTIGEVTLLPHTADDFVLPPLKALEPLSALHANRLADTVATSWQAWEWDLQATFKAAEKNGIRYVNFLLADEVCKRSPDLFHVNQALQAKQKTDADVTLLLAQVFRFACVECQKRGWTLLLSVNSSSADLTRFLACMEGSVGLPQMLVAAKAPMMRDLVLDFAKSKHKNPIRLAVDRTYYPTQSAFEREVTELASLYPLGCLRVIDQETIRVFDC